MQDSEKYYVEIGNAQRYYDGQFICGDVFLGRRLKTQNRILSVLSDGMGHGVKANVLANLTAHIAINFAEEHRDPQELSQIIMETLPICSERHTSYATFTIVDIAPKEVTIIEYDNPTCLVMRSGNIYEPKWEQVHLENINSEGRSRLIHTCTFVPMKEDRVVFISDGVTQAGMGSDSWPFGWQRDSYVKFVQQSVLNNRYIPANTLAQRVVDMARSIDSYKSKDDTSCGVVYFRDARSMLVATGPATDKQKDEEYVQRFKDFKGTKIICGGTTAEIFSRIMNVEIKNDLVDRDLDIPPASFMQGADLVTEGILTLSKVESILNNMQSSSSIGTNGPADKIVSYFMNNDKITFLVGTKINQHHYDASMPVEIEIRRTLIGRIAKILEKKFLKDVKIEYI